MTRGLVLDFAEARRRKATNPRARWRSVAEEFEGEVWPELQPSFRISPGEVVFTIGSCFARNIERHLVALGCRVPMADFRLPPEEFSGEPNGAMNKFHPPAFRQSLAWAAAIFDRDGKVGWQDCEALAFDVGEGLCFDLDMACAPVARERFIERRQHIYDIFATAFSAQCVMMTPGLIEAWRDRSTGLYIHEAPLHKAMHADKGRWELEILSYEQCLADMLAAIDLVRARNPGVKVLVTTSPVPLSATFSGQDVRIANAYSKSVLRAVCGAVTMQRELVDYFPSYESVTLSHPTGIWRPDRIHVASGFIGRIVGRMLDHYLDGVEDIARRYQHARTVLLSGQWAAAEAAAREALAASPGHLESRAVLAEALLRQDRCLEAEAELLPVLERYGDRADLRMMLARALGRSGRAAEAIGHVETAAALPSVTLADFNGVADLVRENAEPERAERLLRRAVELFPLAVDAHEPLIRMLLDQNRKAEAVRQLRQAVELRRVGPGLFVLLAELLAEAGDGEGAGAALKRAFALEPRHAGALALQARLDGAPAGPEPSPAPALEAKPAAKASVWSGLFGARSRRDSAGARR